MSQLPNRPAPHLIRFDADCFETIGETTVWVVGYEYRLSTGPRPVEFNFYEDAVKFARKHGNRPVRKEVRTLRRRIKWG